MPALRTVKLTRYLNATAVPKGRLWRASARDAGRDLLCGTGRFCGISSPLGSKGVLKKSLILLAAAFVLAGCSSSRTPTAGSREKLSRMRVFEHPPSTIVTNMRKSPSGRQVAFELTRLEEPRVVYVVRLADGAVVERIQKPGPIELAGWSGDGTSLYIMYQGQMLQRDVSSARESSVHIALPPDAGANVRMYHAVYVRHLDTFLVKAWDSDRGLGLLYAVPRAQGKGRLITSGLFQVVALQWLDGRGPLVILTTERSQSREQPPANAELVLRRFYYPSTKPPTTSRVSVQAGRIGTLGAMTRDATSAIFCYRDYPWKPVRSRLYEVDLRASRIEAEAGLNDMVDVSRIPGEKDTFLLAGADTLATLSLKGFRRRDIPGGAVGLPTSVEMLSAEEAVIAPGPDIYLVNTVTGKRRVLWSAPRDASQHNSGH